MNNNNHNGEKEADHNHIRLPKELYITLLDYVRNNIDKHLSTTGKCIWYHANYKSPYYDNLSFLYGNTIFSVLIDVIDKNNNSYLRQKHIDRQLAVSEQYNFIPCKYSVVVPNPFNLSDLDPKKIRPLHDGLNLVNTKTGERIIPQKYMSKEKVLMTDWELRHASILYTASFLNSKKCRITRLQDTMEVDPQIWFYAPDGRSSWAIVRFSTPDKKEEIDRDKLNQILNQGFKNNGFYSEVHISPKEGEGLYRNTEPDIKMTQFKQLHSINDFANSGKGNIWEENVRNLVLSSATQQRTFNGSKCEIYTIPNYPEYLIKIGDSYLESLTTFPDNYKFIKIRYEKAIENNNNFGLPVCAILPSDSEHFKKGYLTPEEANKDRKTTLLILRKIPGEHVGSAYRNFYLDLIGDGKFYAFKAMTKNIWEIYSTYGVEQIKTVFDRMEEGALELKKGEIAPGSKQYKFVDPQSYAACYKIFVIQFLKNIQQLAALPQETYDKAVKNLLLPKDFTFDFNHPQNTFIDYEKREFYFIDFVYNEKEIELRKNENVIESFRNILLGKSILLTIQPKDLLFNDADQKVFSQFAQIITSKINNAAPDNLKLTTDSY